VVSLLDVYGQGGSSFGDTSSYRADDPFYMGGLSLGRLQLQPQSSSEAVWGPALQGLIAGALQGYGKKSADDTAYQDYRSSPLLAAYSGRPVGSEFGPLTQEDSLLAAMHDYTNPERPEGWNAKIGKGDLILAALNDQVAREEAIRKATIQDKFAQEFSPAQIQAEGRKAYEIEKQKEAAKGGQIPGVPRGQEGTAIEELGNKGQLKTSLKLVDEVYEAASKVSSIKAGVEKAAASLPLVGGMVPTPDVDEIDRLTETAILQFDKLMGRELNSDVRARLVQKFGIKPYDSAETRIEKRDLLKDALKSAAQGTPMLDLLGAGTEKTPVKRPDPAQFSNFADYKAAKDAWRAANGG
jgi:hypothetical protein